LSDEIEKKIKKKNATVMDKNKKKTKKKTQSLGIKRPRVPRPSEKGPGVWALFFSIFFGGG
jgi:hypothetical protein